VSVSAQADPESATEPVERDSPFKGLVPYDETDADFFFGRDAWREVVVDFLLAYRISLFYGASGVGKSSILRAGVVHHLRELARASLEHNGATEFVVVEFATWKGDAVAAFKEAVSVSVAALSPELARDPPEGSLTEVLSEWSYRLSGEGDVRALVLVILDQFEEYFVYHGRDLRPGSFAAELVDAVGRRDVPANFLISIREDALDRLDGFEPEVGGVFEHLLRFDHLARDAAREAIVGPIEQWHAVVGEDVGVEPELVETVLSEVRCGRLHFGETGRGAAEVTEPGADGLVEAPYLQLVMTRIWQEERRRGSRMLRLDTLRRLGGAERIVERHLTETLSALPRRERAIAARVFAYLVTPDERKIAVPAAALATWVKRDEGRVRVVLKKLTSGERRILREVPSPGGGPTSYEIFHDRLARGVLDYAARYRQRRNRMRIGAIIALVLATAGAALIVLGAKTANQAARLSQLSVIETPYFKALLRGHTDSITSVSFSPDGERILTGSRDGTARLWRTTSGEAIATLAAGGPVTEAAFNPNGRTIATAADSLRIWDGRGRPRQTASYRVASGPTAIAFSGSGNLSATNLVQGRLVTLVFRPPRIVRWRPSGPKANDVARVSIVGQYPLVLVIAEADVDGAVRIYRDSIRPGLPRRVVVRSGAGPLTLIAVSSDGQRIAAAAAGGRVFVWNRDGRRVFRQLLAASPTALRFSPDGRLLVGGATGVLHVWSAQTGRPVSRLSCGTDPVSTAFSPDGFLLAAGCSDGIHVWDTRTWASVTTLEGGGGAVTAVAFSPNGSFLVGGGNDGTARVWLRPGNSDLVLARPDVDAHTTSDGSFVEARVSVSNVGVATSADTTLIGRLDGTTRGAVTSVPALSPGATTPLTLRFRLPSKYRGDRLTLVLRVDPRQLVLQTTRANDVRRAEFTVPRGGGGTVTVTTAPPRPAKPPTAVRTVTVVVQKGQNLTP
jgi:WD40 repeat protein